MNTTDANEIVKIYPLTYKGDHYTVMSNDLIKGKQEMTEMEL